MLQNGKLFIHLRSCSGKKFANKNERFFGNFSS